MNAHATTPTSQLRSTTEDFGKGVGAPFRGMLTIASNPRLWPFAITPTLLLGLLLASGATLATQLYDWLVTRAGGLAQHGAAGSGLLWVTKALIILALAIVVLVVSFVFVPALSAPFMDRIAAKLDTRKLTEPPLLVGAWRSIRVALAGIAVFGIPQLFLAALGALISPLSWLFGAVAWVLSAVALAYDALDWPLARRGLGVRARLAWMGEHKRIVAGLGVGVWIISWVPGLSIVLLAGIVAGGVSLVNHLESVEGPIG
ncbi:MAG: EI24 domain-containing protein [Myxococcales bacterium]|nr:EI24 domain-containing protein [Myxococcales bacterium]